MEFLNTVIDNIDEALKALKLPQICSRVLRGTFADQKICKDCPHRYGFLFVFSEYSSLMLLLVTHVTKISHC